METHRQCWQSTSTRKAVISKAANTAASYGVMGNYLGSLTGVELDIIKMDMGFFLFLLFPLLGHFRTIFSGIMLAIMILKTLIECLFRVLTIYLDRGFGPWVLLGLWNMAYAIFYVPLGIDRETIRAAREEIDLLMPVDDKGHARH